MRLVLGSVFIVLVATVSMGWTDSESELVDPSEVSPSNPAPLTDFRWPEVVLYDNGPLVNSPGTGVGGADESVLQTALGMSAYGAGHQFALGYSIADEFTVTDSAGWQIDDITFFAYQTTSPTTSTITGVYVQIWDGPPDGGGTVVWGDLTTNRLLTTGWSNIYRVSDSTSGSATNRPIMENVATVGTTLAQGTYWVQWSTDGSLSSGPWAPPITINGQTTTGNALQYTTAWAPYLDSGTGTQQGFPFIINGSVATPPEPARPWIQSTYIDDDGLNNSAGNDDLVIQPGESVELYPTLENVGGMDLIDATVCLTTGSPWVAFLFNNCSSYPTIPPGGVGRTNDDFDISVNPAAPLGHVIGFAASVTTPTGSSWDLEFSVVVGNMRVLAISDQTELTAILPQLADMGVEFDHAAFNWDGIQGRATSNLETLSNYSAVVWYGSGLGFGRLTTAEEAAELEACLQSGGRLLVTGYDTLGSPTDPLLASLVRSNSSGDGPFMSNWVVQNAGHPIMDGPFGACPAGLPLTAGNVDHDQANADIPVGAQTVAELGDGTDKIIATFVPGTTGRVVYWNGNYNVVDWTGTPTLIEKGVGPKDRPALASNESLTELAVSVGANELPDRANGGAGGLVLSDDTLAMLEATLEPRSVTSVAFPASGDTYTVASDPYWWHLGDRVEGGRNLVDSVDHVDYTVVMEWNSLTGGGHVDLELSINGITVGSFSVAEGEFLKNVSFDFAPIPGPVYNLRLEETNTVGFGLGSISIPPDLSTLSFEDSQRDIFRNTVAWLLEGAAEETCTIFRDSFEAGTSQRWNQTVP